jgi:hypothetical protein
MNPENQSVPPNTQPLNPVSTPETVPVKNEIPVQEWHRNGTVLSPTPEPTENLLKQVTALTEKPLPQNLDQAFLGAIRIRIFDLITRPNPDPRLIELLVAIFLKLKNYENTNPKSKSRPDVFGNPNGGISAETLARIERQLNLM